MVKSDQLFDFILKCFGHVMCFHLCYIFIYMTFRKMFLKDQVNVSVSFNNCWTQNFVSVYNH